MCYCHKSTPFTPGDTQRFLPPHPQQETAPSPCLECVPAGEGIGNSGRVGGRLDPSPPTPFPFQFPVLLPSSPPCWALLPSPLCQGSLENQERETAQAWVSHRLRPFPRDVIAWEVDAPVWALYWPRWEEAGGGRGIAEPGERDSEVKNQALLERLCLRAALYLERLQEGDALFPTTLSLSGYWVQGWLPKYLRGWLQQREWPHTVTPTTPHLESSKLFPSLLLRLRLKQLGHV